MLTLKNLSYQVDGETIISDQSLSIQTGDHLLLLGASGCGKTTLMNVMAGLLRPSGGEVAFHDQHYVSMSDGALDRLRARHFGFVFQTLHLIGHLSVAQNIALVQSVRDEQRVQDLIGELGLKGREGQKARDLSVGEAQRVAIARAVANNPSVIFADEATSALDDANTEIVMDLLLEQAQKTAATLVVATHDARIKERFKTVLEMTA